MILLNILITVVFIISGFALAEAIIEAEETEENEENDQEMEMILVGIILVIVTCGFAVGVIMINNEEKKFRKQV